VPKFLIAWWSPRVVARIKSEEIAIAAKGVVNSTGTLLLAIARS
jgi:hypothetical protein